jgi:Ca2+:H+ antiporter
MSNDAASLVVAASRGRTVNVLLGLALVLMLVDLVASEAGAWASVQFVVGALALVPLAFVIGEATERLSEHTGPLVGGLLNATMGNAPELMVSLFAVAGGLFTVVRASLVGSVVSNLLLVLGTSMVFAPRGRVSRSSLVGALGQVAFAVVLFAGMAWHYGWRQSDRQSMWFDLPLCAILLVLYVVVTARSVRAAFVEHRRNRAAAEVVEQPSWSLRKGLLYLLLATAATVVVTHVVTDTIEAFSAASGLGLFFTSAVVVAVVGNAAEHGGAVVVAARGNRDLALEISLSSSAQVAVFVLPMVALLSTAFQPLPLAFQPVEIISLAIAVALPALVLGRGWSSRWRGGVLLVGYVALAGAYFIVG